MYQDMHIQSTGEEVSLQVSTLDSIDANGSLDFGVSTDMHTLRESSCTSCGVEQDLSAYWTPALYFMHANGSAEIVEEVGGMLA